MDSLSPPIYGLYGERGDENAGFDLHCETITARSRTLRFEIAQHMHRSFLQMLFLESGQGDATVRQGNLRLAAGSLVTIPPMRPHGFRFSPDTEGLVITLDGNAPAAREIRSGALTGWFDEVRVVDCAAAAEGEKLAGVVRDIAVEFERRMAGRDALLDSLAKTALILAARIGMASGPAEGQAADLVHAVGDPRAARLGALVDRHFREHRSVAFYAAEMGLSVAQINRFVRARFGQSPHELLSRRLIDQACRDLIFTEMPVTEIAHSLGFSDPAYFFRFFQRHAGMTPSAFRRGERAKRQY